MASFFFKDFLKSTIFKVFIEFGTTLLLFKKNFFFFGLEVCGVLAPQLRIELAAPALDGKVWVISS